MAGGSVEQAWTGCYELAPPSRLPPTHLFRPALLIPYACVFDTVHMYACMRVCAVCAVLCGADPRLAGARRGGGGAQGRASAGRDGQVRHAAQVGVCVCGGGRATVGTVCGFVCVYIYICVRGAVRVSGTVCGFVSAWGTVCVGGDCVP